MSRISRRGILQGLVAGALVVGFDPARASWITEAQASVPFAAVPQLDGVLTMDPADLAEAADDWGHIVHRTPLAVLRAGSVDDIIKMVSYCRAQGIRIASRGRGHTAFGQAQAGAGLVIDLKQLDQIHEISQGRAVVDAGVTWRELLLATLEDGQTPPVLTDYINLSIGGTLSVGGVGAASLRHGAQVDNVEELTVVTGTGELVTCSRSENRALFDAALAGLGLCAIIVRATIRLVQAEDRAFTYKLYYPSIPAMLGDIRKLINRQHFDSLRGNGVPTPNGWVWYLEATKFYSAGVDPCESEDDDGDPLAGLSFIPGTTEVEDKPYFEFCDAVTQLLAMLEQFGLLGLPHPWLDLFVPDSKVDQFATSTIGAMEPSLFLPGSLVLFFPFKKNRVKQPMFRVPDEKVFFLFDVLQTAPPDPNVVNYILQRNRGFYDQNRALGGTSYTITALPLSRDDWRAHFDGVWPLLRAAKQVYDPSNILGAGVNVF